MSKIAICFSGHLRYVEEGIKYWKKIVKDYNADVYASFWNISDDIENKIDASTDVEEIKKLKIENLYYKELFIQELKPKKIEFENLKDFDQVATEIFKSEVEVPLDITYDEYQINKKCGYLPMWYKIWRANFLSKSEKYDIVVRTRIDFYLDDNFKFEANENINIPKGTVKMSTWRNCYGPIDLFAYGSPDKMDYYCSLYLYLTRYLKDGHYMHPVENILRVHLSQNLFIINEFDSNISLFRDNYPFNSDFKPSTYLSICDVYADPKFTFYHKNELYNFDISYNKDSNCLLVSTTLKKRLNVSIWNDNVGFETNLIYLDTCIFDYNCLWFSPEINLYNINNIRVEISNMDNIKLIKKHFKLQDE